MKRFVIIGASGQARETAWLIRACAAAGESVSVVGFVVSDLTTLTDTDSRELVLGDETWVFANRHRFDALALGIGTPDARLRVGERLLTEFDAAWWPPLIHPTAVFDRQSCRLGWGCMIAAGVVATVNIEFAALSLANFGCTIGHEARVGEGSVINPGANVGGGVRIGRGVLIGTGAQVLQYRTVGDGSVVGAGAVVVRDVEPNTTVLGIPARPR